MITELQAPAMIDRIIFQSPDVPLYSVSYWWDGNQRTASVYENELYAISNPNE